MRRPLIPLASVAVALSVALALAGCSSKSGGGSSSSPSPTKSGSVAPVVPENWTGDSVPVISGVYGDKPTLTFPKVSAPAKLEKKIVSEGSGPAVNKGDLLVADYFGQIWDGKSFDNSYDRGQPVGFAIGTGKVIAGWDDTLVGVKAGSRVLISLPPAEGYGAAGNTSAGIKGTDTLVFVVDIVSSFSGSATADAKAVVQPVDASSPTVSGALAAKPDIKIPAGLAKPTKPRTLVLAKGSGAPVAKSLVIVQYQVIDWSGATVASTWADKAPSGVNVGQAGAAGVFDGLLGVPIGSRVLIEIPAASGQGPYAAVIDIIGVAKSAKDSRG